MLFSVTILTILHVVLMMGDVEEEVLNPVISTRILSVAVLE
jgi:hypothetical protein